METVNRCQCCGEERADLHGCMVFSPATNMGYLANLCPPCQQKRRDEGFKVTVLTERVVGSPTVHGAAPAEAGPENRGERSLEDLLTDPMVAALAHETVWHEGRPTPAVVAHIRNGLASRDVYLKVGEDRYKWLHRN